MAHIIHKNYRTDWETPQALFDSLNREFGFTLDVAASKLNTKCRYHIGEETDALGVPWSGRVWLNPPYGRGIDRWLNKAVSEVLCNNVEIIVALIPAATDTRWFHEFVLPYASIRFLRGRIQFKSPHCKRKSGNPGPNLIAIYRPPKTDKDDAGPASR